MHDTSYKTRILEVLTNGPLTNAAIRGKVVVLNCHMAHEQYRTDLTALLTAGKVRRVGTTPDGCQYLFGS